MNFQISDEDNESLEFRGVGGSGLGSWKKRVKTRVRPYKVNTMHTFLGLIHAN
jgi:hypothetical protein